MGVPGPGSPGASACLTLGFCSLRSSVGGLLTSMTTCPGSRQGFSPTLQHQSLPAQADVLHCHLVVSSWERAGTCQPTQDGPNTPVAATGPGCRLSGGACPEPCPQVHVLVSHRNQGTGLAQMCLISQPPLPSAPSSGHYYSGAIGKNLETSKGRRLWARKHPVRVCSVTQLCPTLRPSLSMEFSRHE